MDRQRSRRIRNRRQLNTWAQIATVISAIAAVIGTMYLFFRSPSPPPQHKIGTQIERPQSNPGPEPSPTPPWTKAFEHEKQPETGPSIPSRKRTLAHNNSFKGVSEEPAPISSIEGENTLSRSRSKVTNAAEILAAPQLYLTQAC